MIFFCFEWYILCRLTTGGEKTDTEMTLLNLKPARLKYESHVCFHQPPGLTSVIVSAPASLSPVDGTAAKLSNLSLSPACCQREKCQMYLFHPGSEGFFSPCVQRPDAVYVTQRRNINNQYVHRPVADSSESSEHTQRRFPIYSLSLFKLHPCCPENTNDRGFGDKQPENGAFLLSLSLCTPVPPVTARPKQFLYTLLLRLPTADLSKGE